MKINKQDEYGLRIMLRIALADPEMGLSIPQLSELEGLSQPYVGKITRVLRMGGLVQSTRGQKGGYVLTRNADEITTKEVIKALGGNLYNKGFCGSHSGKLELCTHSFDCSVRSLWKIIQQTVDRVLENITLADLMEGEKGANYTLENIFNKMFVEEVIA